MAVYWDSGERIINVERQASAAIPSQARQEAREAIIASRSKRTMRSEVQSLLWAVQARLNGNPTDATDWSAIAKQLRAASDKARKIGKLAAAMNHTTQHTHHIGLELGADAVHTQR